MPETTTPIRMEDVPVAVRDAANEILRTTIATENGRTFPDREAFGKCLTFLAELSDNPRWDFLRGG
jgi:hypothetical protein